MSDNTLVTGINEWLVDQALSEPDIVGMFEGLCHRLHAIGIPLARARLTWPTLHPLFQAETILWNRSKGTEFEQFVHQEEMNDSWLQSPMKHMVDHQISVLRRNLDGPNKLIDFPVLQDVLDMGMTDYLVVATEFYKGKPKEKTVGRGIVVTWSADRPGGFSDKEIEALQKIQRRFAVACKTAVQTRISHNIVETYLGKRAGDRVLSGEIRRNDHTITNAVVWYSDLRSSTALADTMAGEDYLQLLNSYFEATAGPVIEAGGEVLDFIGDAVLAIFPFDDEEEKNQAICAATRALQNSVSIKKKIERERITGGLAPIKFGVALNVGSLMFGNIGVAERLTFSIIGPTVNEVSRIEALTKITGNDILVTKDVASSVPDTWTGVGEHTLQGVSQKVELFTLAVKQQTDKVVPLVSGRGKKAEAKTVALN